MGYLIVDFITQLRHLEKVMAIDFQNFSGMLKKKAAFPEEKAAQYKVVGQLQYHDIMRQKMEHIRELMEEITEEQRGQEMNKLPADLFELTLALLRYIQIEYEETLSKTDPQALHTAVGEQISTAGSPFYLQLQGLIKSLERVYLEINEDNKREVVGKEHVERVRKILGSFSMKSERDIFYALFQEEAKRPGRADDENENTEGQVELF